MRRSCPKWKYCSEQSRSTSTGKCVGVVENRLVQEFEVVLLAKVACVMVGVVLAEVVRSQVCPTVECRVLSHATQISTNVQTLQIAQNVEASKLMSKIEDGNDSESEQCEPF